MIDFIAYIRHIRHGIRLKIQSLLCVSLPELYTYSIQHILCLDIFFQARSWTVMTGFSMAFGALFVKTWRVHAIFTNKTKKVVRIFSIG